MVDLVKINTPAVFYVLRRLLTGIGVLLASTFVMFLLVVWSGDPRQNFETYPPNVRDGKIRAVTEALHLDQSVPARYFGWLRGAVGCVVPGMQCDLGKTIDNTEVTSVLGGAITTTLRLVLLALALAVVFGVIVGIVSALRQYSALDYTVTFASFLFYSLPIFWVAVLLKQFGAIRFNSWLGSPTIPIGVSVVLGLLAGLLLAAAIGGTARRRWTTLGATLLVVVGLLQYASAVSWFARPALGPFVIVVLAGVIAAGVTGLVSGLRVRRVLYSAAAAAVVGAVAGIALKPALVDPSLALLLGLAAAATVVSGALGWFIGGAEFRGQAVRAAVLTGGGTGLVVIADRVLRNVHSFTSVKGGRPIPTVGDSTPSFQGNLWQHVLDLSSSLLLPTIALILISFAGYTRYTRASMLEVMNQDYIRTARAKGLTERTVVMRHAFRNALIPLTTVVAYDFAAVIGGAVITENVFGWKGMGTLFINGLQSVNPNVVMAFFLITGVSAVVFNLIADLLYTALDPRIRLQ